MSQFQTFLRLSQTSAVCGVRYGCKFLLNAVALGSEMYPVLLVFSLPTNVYVFIEHILRGLKSRLIGPTVK